MSGKLPEISERACVGLASLMRDPDARFFIARLLRLTGVYARGPKANEPLAQFMGRRSIGIELLEWMAFVDPDFEPNLMKEIRDYVRALDEQRAGGDSGGRDDGSRWFDPEDY